MFSKSDWPKALVNIVFISGVIFTAVTLQCSDCLWAFLLMPALWGYK